MRTKSLLTINFFLLVCFQTYCQENEWTRIATPGYKEYAPVTLANGIYGLTLSENALFGNQLQMNGIFDFFPKEAQEKAVKGIDFTQFDLVVMSKDDARTEQADVLKGAVYSNTELDDLTDWKQEFNIYEGSLQTDFTFQGLTVEHTIYALKNMSNTGIVKFTFTARDDVVFNLRNILTVDEPYRMKGSKFMNQLRERRIPLFTGSALTPTGKYRLATTSSFYFEENHRAEVQYVDDATGKPSMGFRKELQKGESFTCYLIGSVSSTYTYSNPEEETARLNIYTYLKGPEKVISEHKSDWKNFWDTTDIIVEGEAELTKDLRQMMFFINSFVRPGTDFSAACMGLGTDYWGYRTLWDADFWIYPALLLINPDAAKSMLEYRWKRLDMAKKNAAAHGYKGAMFPWESGSTGEEQASLVYLTGPFQHHITSDVGLAFWYYYCVTQDKNWLAERGYPLLKEVAKFWLSRVENTNDGYEIKNVVSSDEYALNVDNDAFTNASAKSVLDAAIKASKILGEKPDKKWSEVANGLVIRSFESGVTREYETYNGETIKQASVNLCSFPLNIISDQNQIKRNLAYYEPKIDEHGPNMSWSMYSGAALRSGDAELGKEYFEKSLIPYKKGPFSILALRTYLQTTFFGTSGGGMLQAFIMGFGGLRFTENGLVQEPGLTNLPKDWKSIFMKGIGNSQNFEVKQ